MTHSHQLMHGFAPSGWRWARILCLATVCVTNLISQKAYGQPVGKDMGYGYCSKHGNYKGASCPGCAAGSNSSQSGNFNYDPNRVTIFNFFSKMKEKKREARERQAYDANEEGIQHAQNGDFAKALAAYERAAVLDPTDPVIQANLAKARARQREIDAQARAEQLRKLESAEAAKRMQQSIQNLAQSLTAASSGAPTTGGLDFDGGNTSSPSSISGNALDFTATLASLPNTDPMVVDARNVSSGLPKSVEESIPHTPAGNRVRKGFQAIADHDWRVALAWFQDAYIREPGDPGLQRLIDLAQFTLDSQTKEAVPPVAADQPKSVPSSAPATDSPDIGADRNPSLIPMTRNNPVARSAATQMAAASRVQEVYAELHKKYGPDIPPSVRWSRETNLKINQARRGEGLPPEQLRAQLEAALTEYLKTHKTSDPRGVGGSATADEIILGGKG